MIDMLAAATAEAVNTGVSAGGVAGIAAAGGVGGVALTIGTLLIKRGFSFQVGDEKAKNEFSKELCDERHESIEKRLVSIEKKIDMLIERELK